MRIGGRTAYFALVLLLLSGATVGLVCALWESFDLKHASSTESAVDAAAAEAKLFQQITGVPAIAFHDVRCFIDAGIDVSSHCRFRFNDFKDLEEIISRNRLTQENKLDVPDSPRRKRSLGLAGTRYPEWYDLREIPYDSPTYSFFDGTPGKGVVLYIDIDRNIGYFEEYDF
ncbi:MAG: hypothetical protein JNL58_21360 [Planctomyces sp.]|nr:hypothetical protein [Planctomyces sp.]